MSSGTEDNDSFDGSASEAVPEDNQPLPVELKAVDTGVMDEDSVRGSASPEGAYYFRGQ